MNRKHALAISLLLALAVVAGAFAATRGETDAVAGSTPLQPEAAVGMTDLDRYERSLDTLIARAKRADRDRVASGSSGSVTAVTTAGTIDDHGGGGGDDTWDDHDDDDDDDHHGGDGDDADDHGGDDEPDDDDDEGDDD